jgi:hypothetical protein
MKHFRVVDEQESVLSALFEVQFSSTGVKNANVIISACKMSDILCPILTSCREIFVKFPDIKFHENSFSGICADPRGSTE